MFIAKDESCQEASRELFVPLADGFG